MRVIAGKAKGLKLKTPPKSRGVRPLTDQAREALFNILGERTFEASFLDLFAGTGAVGIEALSRGAQLAFFVELDRGNAALIRQNLELTGFADRGEIYNLDAVRALDILGKKGAKFDLIFLGAPYGSPALEAALVKLPESGLLTAGGVVIAEHRKQSNLPAEYGNLKLAREARYGETVLSFFRTGTPQ